MRKTIIAGAAIMASLALAGTAQADTVSTDFESFTSGVSVHNMDGWKATEEGGNYDENIVTNADDLLVPFGQQSLRMSSLVADGNFEGWVYSAPVNDGASESAGMSHGFTNEFTFKALGQQNGLTGGSASHLSMSASDEHGHRMSYVRIEDNPEGVQVFFVDSPNSADNDGFQTTQRWIATLNRNQAHTIMTVMTLVPGEDNDVVNIFIDNEQVVCGGSWENYYRYTERNVSKGGDAFSPLYLLPVNRMIMQARAASTDFGQISTPNDPSDDVPAAERGFLIDNVTTTTTPEGMAVACPQPSGTQGLLANAGTTTIVNQTQAATKPRKIGDTMRIIHAPKYKGMKLVSLRAVLRWKALPVSVKRQAVKVDLRGKPVGNYNVYVTAKYRKADKLHTVRFMRALSVTRAMRDSK